MRHQKWECPKCGNKDFQEGRIATTGGGLSRFFDVQSNKFITLTCTRCTYTELYKTHTSGLAKILDFLSG
ncbi:MAG TPA: GTP-binding protein [Firmicutes bacterium]|nr:GTP-binding protein [Bacillota bacterium]